MHLVVINGSPRMEKRSNTARIIRSFLRGFAGGDNTAEVWHLSDKRQWAGAKEAFEKNENILFATPLYVENLPGMMLEFLEFLEPKKISGTKMAFLLQGAFAEASQLRCGEAYLETLPKYFNCEHAGTLIKGDNFGPAWVPEKMAEKMVACYEEMGRYFAERGYFEKEDVTEFAKPEYFDKKTIWFHENVGRGIKWVLFNVIAKISGCARPLSDRPYQEEKV